MNVYPIVLDSLPSWAKGSPAASLLTLPLGQGTLLSHIRSRILPLTPHPLTVFTDLEDDASYKAALQATEPSVRAVVGRANFRASLDGYEPSDWLLVVDPTCIPVTGLAPESLLRYPTADPRWARHLVALDSNADGTRECVDVDAKGNVRRIQRFYDAVTWPFTAGVSCSLLPAACALLGEDLPWTSLAEMRQALAGRGIPSRDLPIAEEVVNLAEEEGVLAFSEPFIAQATAGVGRRSSAAGVLYVGNNHRVDRSARLIGPVIIQSGAVLEEGSTVLGPALIGSGAHIGREALVAQSVVAAGALVPAGTTVRHRVFFHAADAPPAPARTPYRASQSPGTAALRAQVEERGTLYESCKPFLEGLAAVVALVLLSPLLLIIAALIKLESRGPVLYGHKREGRNGRLFSCWKFRTMYQGAQARERELQAAQNQVDGPQFKMTDDPRITRVGRWLRPASLDELPQFLNVALGQMSLVGPRPSPFRENQLCVPWREGRLSVRPGITGLWQVCRHDRSAGDFHQWIQYDLLYVRHNSFTVDLKILVATVLTGGGKGHVPLSWIIPSSALEEGA